MRKFILFVLLSGLVCLSCADRQPARPKLSEAEMKMFMSRVRIQRLPDVSVTHADVYQIRTQQPVYTPQTKQIICDVINVNGPIAIMGNHRLKQWRCGKWRLFPFEDNYVFLLLAKDLLPGDTLPEDIHMFSFKKKLRRGKYQVNFDVLPDIYTYCHLTNDSIMPIVETEMKGAFVFKILPSANDSIRILFENHTNLDVQPISLPSVSTDETSRAHPLVRSDSGRERSYMECCARLKGGEAMLLTIPVSWDLNKVWEKRYRSGRLLPGRYKIGLPLYVYMDTEFDVK